MNDGTLTVALGDRSYDIFFGTGIYPLVQEWVTRFNRGGTVFVVTDRNVSSIYGDDVRKWLSGIPHRVLVLPPGEEEKHLGTVQEIYSFLARGGAGRDSLVVAFGGGVVGDLAGFAAATFLRGLPYIQVPTTLLSQVDSSVGGKTGFNLAEGKNLVGAFHQPAAVFIDPSFLLTLDGRNVRAGMAEVVKCALAGDPVLLEAISSEAGSWKAMAGGAWLDIIRRAVAFKASVVERDEREASARRILNLGHTVGHAMEQAAGYGRLLHGEAVAMGLAWEAVFSRRYGEAPPGMDARVIDLLLEMGFPLDEPSVPLPAIASAIGMDKKRVSSDIDMPLLSAPGACVLRRIPAMRLREELPAIRKEIRERIPARTAAEAPREAPPPREKGIAGPDEVRTSIASLERRVVEDPRDVAALIALSEAYLRAGNTPAAWETVKEALHQSPSSAHAQRAAREIEREMSGGPPEVRETPSPLLEDVVILEEGAFELRPAETDPRPAGETAPPDMPGARPGDESAPVRTVTMASVYWDQGRREEARRIIEEILRKNPGDLRALAWREVREGTKTAGNEKAVISALTVFLDTIAKEYAHDVPRHH